MLHLNYCFEEQLDKNGKQHATMKIIIREPKNTTKKITEAWNEFKFGLKKRTQASIPKNTTKIKILQISKRLETPKNLTNGSRSNQLTASDVFPPGVFVVGTTLRSHFEILDNNAKRRWVSSEIPLQNTITCNSRLRCSMKTSCRPSNICISI